MNITVNDNLASLASGSAAAVVAMVPVNTCALDGVGTKERELDPVRADTMVRDLLRTSAGGPLAFVVIHNANAWADCFGRHGLITARGTYLFDSFDVVLGSAGPTEMPADTFIRIGELVQAITSLVSKQGDTVVIPFAFDPLATIAVAGMNRQAIAVANSPAHVTYLQTTLAGDVQTQDINDEQYADVLRRLSNGESASGIARSLGIVGDRLCRRLEKDGIRAHRKRGKAKAAATA